MEMTPRMRQNQLIARSAAAGSMVLLRNVHNTLPLVPGGSEPFALAVFGVGQHKTVQCDGLSPWGKSSIIDGLRQAETIRTDSLLAHKYKSHLENTQEEMPVSSFSMEEFASENQAALVVISRCGGTYDTQLSPVEQHLISAVTSAFERSILVLNTPNVMEIGAVASQFGAVIFMGIPGQEGGVALGDLLTGETVFSGKLATEWCGQYPFGHGLGYGTCAMDTYAMGLDGSSVTVDVQFTNISETHPAREVLQVYFSTPCNFRSNYILDGFVKTKLLQPGDSEKISYTFPVTEMARYHSGKEAYILDAGHYDIRLGTSAHNTFVAGSIFIPKEIVVLSAPSLGTSLEQPAMLDQYTYPQEAEELEAARAKAIRLPMRQIRKKAAPKVVEFTLCSGAEEGLTFPNCVDFKPLVASMSDDDLEMVYDGCAVEKFQIPALKTVGGVGGLELSKVVRNDEGEVVSRRHVTAFPVPSLLACSFDRELISAVGQAIGREVREYGFHLYQNATTAEICRKPSQGNCALWSQEPVVAGLCASWFLQGCQSFVPGVLYGGNATQDEMVDRNTNWLGYEIAMKQGKPRGYNGNLPLALVAGQWKFHGTIWRDETRLEMEQSVLSILKLMRYLKR